MRRVIAILFGLALVNPNPAMPQEANPARAGVAERAEPYDLVIRGGTLHVLVNGTQVLSDGEHTGAKPGRAVWGRGRKTEKP